MNKRDVALRRYYRRIRAWLPCTRKMKRQIIDEIQSRIEEYLLDNPIVSVEEIESYFGTPQDIASAYVDNLDSQTLLRNLNVKRKIAMAVGCTAFTLFFCWVMYLGTATYELLENRDEFILVEIKNGIYDITEETGVVKYYP